MRTIFLLVIAFFTINSEISFAKGPEIDSRYKGGDLAFRKFLAQHLKYPVHSVDNRTVGYSITALTITPDGEIVKILSMNPIDQYIDEDIKKVIGMTKNKWLRSDSVSTNQTFYIQIAYVISRFLGREQEVNNPVKGGYNFVDPVVLTAAALNKKSLPVSDEYIVNELSEAMKKNELTEALKCVDELIKRNPFNKKLYQLRISINKGRNRKDLILEDAQKMQNFIPGVTLDELIN